MTDPTHLASESLSLGEALPREMARVRDDVMPVYDDLWLQGSCAHRAHLELPGAPDFGGSMVDVTRTSKERAEFERWLFDEQGLESVWEPHRNCHKDFAAHLAFKAWQAARSTPEPVSAPKWNGDMLDYLKQQMVARCEHGNPIEPTGNYVCMKCFNAPASTANR